MKFIILAALIAVAAAQYPYGQATNQANQGTNVNAGYGGHAEGTGQANANFNQAPGGYYPCYPGAYNWPYCQNLYPGGYGSALNQANQNTNVNAGNYGQAQGSGQSNANFNGRK